MENEQHFGPETYIQSNESIPKTTDYADAFRILNECPEKLRRAGPDDIDTLGDVFRRAMAAYRICAERLNRIRQEIDLEIAASEGDASTTPRSSL